MKPENRGSPVVFVNTDTAIFSRTSRRVARSHAAMVSRQRQKATKRTLTHENGRSGRKYTVPVARPEKQSPKTLLDTALLDPFGTTALPMDRKMSGLLQSCKSCFAFR